MAKEKTPPTAAEKALLAARQKHELANKAHAEKPTDKTGAAVEAAKAEVQTHSATVNRERFVRVAGGRVKKARTAVRNISNVANPRSYSYTEEDVAKAEAALNAEVKKTIDKLRSALTKGPSVAKSEDDFTF